jgi:type IV pilus assembly protein PilB
MRLDSKISTEQLSALVSLSDDEQQASGNKRVHQDPISRYIDQVLSDAVQKRASDIHIEPYENHLRIRLRCDGVLVEIDSPDRALSNRFSSRIKVMANLDITERRLPQDGRIKHYLSDNHPIDIRVSTLPTQWGEKVVLRILNTDSSSLNIFELGMSSSQVKCYLDAISKPQGLVLITGPTGSGKTVSLYSALKYLNTPERNISTVEDPVEINLQGINQVQINDKLNLSFVQVLKALLRQDPDIIMVGEIRDSQSAEIVAKAALTGHLVLSTLHTNSASEAITRMLNMGVDRFSLAGSLSLIVAQRLTRKLCDGCKQESLVTPPYQHRYPNLLPEETYYQANSAGCPKCLGGYIGRIAFYELLSINSDIKQAIEQNKSITDIERIASSSGFTLLSDSGLKLVRSGKTSLEELQRNAILDGIEAY